MFRVLFETVETPFNSALLSESLCRGADLLWLKGVEAGGSQRGLVLFNLCRAPKSQLV